MKLGITGISAVGIIYRERNPGEIFIEMKDDGHPIKLVRRQLCFIGGNWIGEGAREDRNPLDTFRREFTEELSFDRPMRSSVEYAELGIADEGVFQPTPIDASPTDEDHQMLRDLKKVVLERVRPFGSWLNRVMKAALDSADPGNKRDGFTTLATYYLVPLSETWWEHLAMLQRVFNNLSNESITLTTSLDEIVEHGVKTSFGHDRVLQSFFLSHGLERAGALPMVPHIESIAVGPPLESYDEYLERYEIAKKPV